MKTNRITMQSRLAIAAALLVTSAGLVAAGETATAKGGAAKLIPKVIELHAPNNATRQSPSGYPARRLETVGKLERPRAARPS